MNVRIIVTASEEKYSDSGAGTPPNLCPLLFVFDPKNRTLWQFLAFPFVGKS